MRIEIFGIKNVRKVIHVVDVDGREHIKRFLVLDFMGRLHEVVLDLKAGIAKVSKWDL